MHLTAPSTRQFEVAVRVWVISWWNEERGDTEGGKNAGLGSVEGDRVGLFVASTVELKATVAVCDGSCSMAVSSSEQATSGVSTILDLASCENSSGGDNEGSELRNFVVARGDDGSSLCEIDDKYGAVAGTAGSEMTQGDSANREHCWQDVEDGDDGEKATGNREASLQPILFTTVCGTELSVVRGVHS